MDRRAFLGGSAAVLSSGFLSGIPGQALAATPAQTAPRELLTSTFESLTGSLLPAGAWHPFPQATDRAGWTALPPDLRDAIAKRADEANTGDWPALLATEALEFKRNGNRTRFEALTFGRRARLAALVLGECMAAKGAYLDQIANGIWLICEESFWGVPAHLGAQKAGVGLADVAEPVIELFGAETAATLAWVAYLLPEGLQSVSPLLLPRITVEARRRILEPYVARDDFFWMGLNGKPHHLNNWNPWINSNVLTATLLLETDPGRRSALVARICHSLDAFLADYSPDGGCEEGPGYWSRSAASYFDCCSRLVSAHGGKGGTVLTHPFVRAMGHYITDVHIAGNQYVNYGDAHVEASPEPELMHLFGQATHDDTLAAFGSFEASRRGLRLPDIHSGGVASMSRDLQMIFAVEETRRAAKQDALTRESWYPNLGLMTAREKEGSVQGLYIAFQAASNGRPHGHNDSGSFLLYCNGEPVLIDVGVEAYTAQTFSKDRYKIWTMQSAFHNLPLINGMMQHEGDAFRASEVRFTGSGARTTVEANLATAYPAEAGANHWTRRLTLDRTARTVELYEQFTLAKESPVLLSFMAAKQPEIKDGSIRIGNVILGFDPAALRASSETIALHDAGLRHSWGDAVWRLQLTATSPVKAGDWKVTFKAIGN
ncbi:MAG TPA: heparinase II/III family protein [Acidobacteriaceae bacterium]|jgi:hypothetical protein